MLTLTKLLQIGQGTAACTTVKHVKHHHVFMCWPMRQTV